MTNPSGRRPQLRAGWHFDPADGACLMEYVSMLAGVRFTDAPRCTDPLLAGLAQLVNDLASDGARPGLVIFAPQLAELPRSGVRSAPAIVQAALDIVVDIHPNRRDLGRHQRRARRRAAAARRAREQAVSARLLDAIYRRGAARHALMCAVRVVSTSGSEAARDQLLYAMLDAAITAAAGHPSDATTSLDRAAAQVPR